MAVESIEDLFERYGPGYQWLAAMTCMLGAMTMVLSQTTVNVAFPDIMGAFGIGRDEAQWLSSGFFAAMTAGMLLQAWLVSIFGERATYFTSLLGFLVGVVMSGLAPNAETLTAGRLLQGLTAGIIQPLAMAICFKVFPPSRRGTAMGLFSMGIVFAPAMGPTLGGFAIEWFNWRYAFFLTVPSTVLALGLGLVFLPSRKMPSRIPPFDLTGFALMCISLFTLLLALSSGTRDGWSSDKVVLLFTCGTTAALGFVAWETYIPSPLLNVRLFLNLRFSSASIISFFAGGVFLTSTFLIPVFVQQIQGYTPLRAGLLLMPGGLSLLILFPIAGRISDTISPQVLICIGLGGFAAGFFLLSGTDVNTPFWTFVAFTLFIRLGIAFTTPVVNAAALKSLPMEQVNQGSGAVNFIRMLGAAFSLNIVVAFLETRVPFHSDAITATQTAASPTSQAFLAAVRRVFSEAGVADALEHPGALHYLGEVVYAQANSAGFQDAFMALAIASVCGLIPVYVLSKTPAHAARAVEQNVAAPVSSKQRD